MPPIAYLESVRSHNRLSADTPQTLDPATAESLYVRMYDRTRSARPRTAITRLGTRRRRAVRWGMWRYKDVLPAVDPRNAGRRLDAHAPLQTLPRPLHQGRGRKPTGSFKARGLSMAVSMARHYGLRHLAVPSAGNAAGALAAYAAAAGITAHLYMPKDVPFANLPEGIIYGADVHMVDGLISDCARLVGEQIKAQIAAGIPAEDVWFDLSTPQGALPRGRKKDQWATSSPSSSAGSTPKPSSTPPAAA